MHGRRSLFNYVAVATALRCCCWWPVFVSLFVRNITLKQLQKLSLNFHHRLAVALLGSCH